MKGWDNNANKRNRGNQHYRTSELLLRIQILFFSSFFFLLCFLSLFSEAWSRNTNKSAQWDLFVQNEEHALQTRAKFPDYGGSGLWIFLYGVALWY
jgi:hypothetical protein